MLVNKSRRSLRVSGDPLGVRNGSRGVGKSENKGFRRLGKMGGGVRGMGPAGRDRMLKAN